MPSTKGRTRGHIEQRASGRYRAIVYAGVEPLTGQERYLREWAPTKKAAQAALARLQTQVDERRHPRTGTTFGELLDQWMEVSSHESSTRERYADLIRLYLRPTFGTTPAGKIDAELLEMFYGRLRRCRELCLWRCCRLCLWLGGLARARACLCLLFRKRLALLAPETRVLAVVLEQLCMRALLDHAASIQDDNFVAVDDCRQTVRNRDHRCPYKLRLNHLLYQIIRQFIDTCRRLIHQQHFGIVGQRTGYRGTLLHPARELARIVLGKTT